MYKLNFIEKVLAENAKYLETIGSKENYTPQDVKLESVSQVEPQYIQEKKLESFPQVELESTQNIASQRYPEEEEPWILLSPPPKTVYQVVIIAQTADELEYIKSKISKLFSEFSVFYPLSLVGRLDCSKYDKMERLPRKDCILCMKKNNEKEYFEKGHSILLL